LALFELQDAFLDNRAHIGFQGKGSGKVSLGFVGFILEQSGDPSIGI
jgi:hypothetical protein